MVPKRKLVRTLNVCLEADEIYPLNGDRSFERGRTRVNRHPRSQFRWISVNAAADCGERDRFQATLTGKLHGSAVATGEQVGLASCATPPDWPDGVNHVPGQKIMAGGDLRIAGCAAPKRAAFGEQRWAGRAVDADVDDDAAEQTRVCGIDDRADVECRDVGRGDR